MSTATPAPCAEGELTHAAQKIGSLYHSLPTLLTQLLLAGLVIVLGMLFLRFLRFILNKRLLRKNNLSPHAYKQRETLRSLLVSVISYLLYFLIALMVLNIFGIDLTGILAVAGIGSIAIGFGAQTLVKDIISGMFLWLEGHINIGDIVTVADFSGRVENITLRTTLLRGADDSIYAVPNGDIRTVICRSHGMHEAQVAVTVAHGQDMLRAQAVLQEECALIAKELSLSAVPQVYACISADARCMTMRADAPCNAERYWETEQLLRLRLYERLRAEGIKP